jgi:hypothetical protein
MSVAPKRGRTIREGRAPPAVRGITGEGVYLALPIRELGEVAIRIVPIRLLPSQGVGDHALRSGGARSSVREGSNAPIGLGLADDPGGAVVLVGQKRDVPGIGPGLEPILGLDPEGLRSCFRTNALRARLRCRSGRTLFATGDGRSTRPTM